MPKAKRATNKKPPLLEVPSDDFTVAVGGEEYHPHAGESITFRGAMSVEDYMVMLEMQEFQDVDDATAELPRVKAAAEKVCETLAAAIVRWTWTDDAGEPYPSPPGSEALRRLSFDELGYIIEKGFQRAPKETAGNA